MTSFFPETEVDTSENLPPLTEAAIKRVEEGVAAASDRLVRAKIETTLEQLSAIDREHREQRVHPKIRQWVMRSLIHSLFRVQVENLEQVPQQPAILAVNHLHHIDPLLLLSELPTQPYYYIIGDARTLYNKWWKRLVLSFAGGVIPLQRIWKEELAVINAAKSGKTELQPLAAAIEQNVNPGGSIQVLRQIEKIVLAILAQGDSLIVFPEGKLGEKEGYLHPLKRGVVIYALRAGVPIIPVALTGTQDLFFRKQLTIRFGEPLYFPSSKRPKREEIDDALKVVQSSLQNLLPTNYQEPPGIKLFRHFLNHLLW